MKILKISFHKKRLSASAESLSRFLESIKETGLIKQSRLHVHLSTNEETANKVGQRHGKPIILKIKAFEMAENGFIFHLSENNVWLTDNIPTDYIIFP